MIPLSATEPATEGKIPMFQLDYKTVKEHLERLEYSIDSQVRTCMVKEWMDTTDVTAFLIST